MLSQLKSYLFGGGDVTGMMTPPSAMPQAEASFIINSIAGRTGDDEDWVLVESQDTIGELPDGLEMVTSADLEESWIVTQEGGMNGKMQRRNHRNCQPKGTKPRRWKGKNNKNSSSSQQQRSQSLEDNESTSSSIAIVPSPERDRAAARTSPTATAAVLAASVDAQQVAAISAARSAKSKVDKTWMSRKSLMRGNQTAMAAAAGRNQRRGQLMVSRLCGSNNNRKSHSY